MSEELFAELREVENTINTARLKLEELTEKIEQLKRSIVSEIAKRIEEARYTKFNPDALPDFLSEPYLILPKRLVKGKAVEWYIIVPRFIDFQLGWLERQTKSYNIFVLNQYVNWFAEVPQELQRLFDLKPLPVKVADGLLLVDPDKQEEAWRRYRKWLTRREGEGAIRIKRGSEFQLIAQIIEDGCLPFIPQPVDKEDLRTPLTDIKLRDYQEEAWRTFLRYGAIGVFWPFGTGKSFFGLYALAALKGPKLVVVPYRTLKEQWEERIRRYLRWTAQNEVRVETYQAFHKVRDKQFTLIVYDEVHHLPANSFIRLATLKTKYRIGLSGSPYREDGRVNYIIALTGYPLGLSWEKFFQLGIIRKPLVIVHVCKNLRDKLRKLKELLAQETGRTVIFCDSIKLGKRLANEYGLIFVHGETTRRLEKIRENERVIVSRVGDEGLSLPDIDTIIEVDFLYGSRMQQSQRAGRLLHSKREATTHYILMTEEELARYGKRLLALYERGYRVNIVR